MHLSTLFMSALPLLCTYATAAPQATSTCTDESATTATATPITTPTAAYGVMSTRSGSEIHLLPMQARGNNFYLGGSPGAYCPQPPVTNCPAGVDTIFAGLGALSVPVPGGQGIYVRRDGSLGFTQAHSASYPEGAILGGDLTYSKIEGAQFGTLGTQAFGAKGFMACPTQDQGYQVFASISNATVPEGDLSACLGFNALTIDATDASRGAWQYI